MLSLENRQTQKEKKSSASSSLKSNRFLFYFFAIGDKKKESVMFWFVFLFQMNHQSDRDNQWNRSFSLDSSCVDFSEAYKCNIKEDS